MVQNKFSILNVGWALLPDERDGQECPSTGVILEPSLNALEQLEIFRMNPTGLMSQNGVGQFDRHA